MSQQQAHGSSSRRARRQQSRPDSNTAAQAHPAEGPQATEGAALAAPAPGSKRRARGAARSSDGGRAAVPSKRSRRSASRRRAETASNSASSRRSRGGAWRELSALGADPLASLRDSSVDSNSASERRPASAGPTVRLTRAEAARRRSRLQDAAQQERPASRTAAAGGASAAAAETTGVCQSSCAAADRPSRRGSAHRRSRHSSGGSADQADTSAQPGASADMSQQNAPGNESNQASSSNVGQQQQQQQQSAAAAAAHHFLGLVPRLLGGTGSSAAGAAAAAALHHQQSQAQSERMAGLVEGLRSDNELRQQEAALELAELLLMGNEESLAGLPIREIVQALCTLMARREHNLELTLTAVRCITNLLEVLPRAVPLLLDAVPLLLDKLKRIECMDVAEQALAALEVLSRRYGKSILQAGGIAAATAHLDFFSAASQRLALAVAANCGQHVQSAHDFAQHVRPCLPELTQRFALEDKRAVESVCSLFARLTDNLRAAGSDRLHELAGHGLLEQTQLLLGAQPPLVGPDSFRAVLRMLRQLCQRCPPLAVRLVHIGMVRTVRKLLTGDTGDDSHLDSMPPPPKHGRPPLEIVHRPPQQLLEIVMLVGEFTPPPPMSGIFEIDAMLSRTYYNSLGAVLAQAAAAAALGLGSAARHAGSSGTLPNVGLLGAQSRYVLAPSAGSTLHTTVGAPSQLGHLSAHQHSTAFAVRPASTVSSASGIGPSSFTGAAAIQQAAAHSASSNSNSNSGAAAGGGIAGAPTDFAAFQLALNAQAGRSGSGHMSQSMHMATSTTASNWLGASHQAVTSASGVSLSASEGAALMQALWLQQQQQRGATAAPPLAASDISAAAAVLGMGGNFTNLEQLFVSAPLLGTSSLGGTVQSRGFAPPQTSNTILVQERRGGEGGSQQQSSGGGAVDARQVMLDEEPQLAQHMASMLLPVLIEIDTASAGAHIRQQCVRTMLRLARVTDAAGLAAAIGPAALASHIAGCLAATSTGTGVHNGGSQSTLEGAAGNNNNSSSGTDYASVVAALQLTHVLCEKLPNVYVPAFRKQGVAHHLRQLADAAATVTPDPSPGARRRPKAHSTTDLPAQDQSPLTRSPNTRHTYQPGSAVPPPSGVPVATTRTGARATPPAAGTMPAPAHPPSAPTRFRHQVSVPGQCTSGASPGSSSGSTGGSGGGKDRRRAFLNSLRLPAALCRTGGHGAAQQPTAGKSRANTSPQTTGAGSSQHQAAGTSAPAPSQSVASGGGSQPPLDAGALATLDMCRRMGVTLGGSGTLAAGGSDAQQQALMHAYASTVAQQHLAVPAHDFVSQSRAATSASNAGMLPSAAVYHATAVGEQHKRALKSWIAEHAGKLLDTYFNELSRSPAHSTAPQLWDTGDTCLALATIGKQLADPTTDAGDAPLRRLRAMLEVDEADPHGGGISAFELAHSGIVPNLVKYLTEDRSGVMAVKRLERLRRFAKVFMGLEARIQPGGKVIQPDATACQSALVPLVHRVLACVAHTEKLPVRANELLAQTGLRGAAALKFFHSHQIKCTLRRDPAYGGQLREWRHGHGSIRVDPLTPVAAIERYLVERNVIRAHPPQRPSQPPEQGAPAAAAPRQTQRSKRHSAAGAVAGLLSSVVGAAAGAAGAVAGRSSRHSHTGTSTGTNTGTSTSTQLQQSTGTGQAAVINNPNHSSDSSNDSDNGSDTAGANNLAQPSQWNSSQGDGGTTNSSLNASASYYDDEYDDDDDDDDSPPDADEDAQAAGGDAAAQGGPGRHGATAGATAARASAGGSRRRRLMGYYYEQAASGSSASGWTGRSAGGAAAHHSGATHGGRLQIVLNEHPLPSDMTMLQALHQYAAGHQLLAAAAATGAPVSDADAMTLAASLWVDTHTLWYRVAPADPSGSSPMDASSAGAQSGGAADSGGNNNVPSGGVAAKMGSALGRASSGAAKRRSRVHVSDDALWNDGQVPARQCPLTAYLSSQLPLSDCVPSLQQQCRGGGRTSNSDTAACVTRDPSYGCLLLLRAMYGLNKYWYLLYQDRAAEWPERLSPAIAPSMFVSSPLSAKVLRQLADVLTVVTQQPPPWMLQLAHCCPFVLSFSSRRHMFYATAFGRDRGLAHMVAEAHVGPNGAGGPAGGGLQAGQHNGGGANGGGHGDAHDYGRLSRAVEKRKVLLKRDDLLKQAEEAMGRHASGARATLEVGFAGEMGTGHGPTLEFYASVSRELQRAKLKLWHGETYTAAAEHAGGADEQYVRHAFGLYPLPVGPHGPTGGNRAREQRLKKFEFIGRLMGQALVDRRMLDLPLNPLFYRWLSSGADRCSAESSLSPAYLCTLDAHLWRSLRSVLQADKAELEALCCVFTMPGAEQGGPSAFPLCKNGGRTEVSESNSHQFVSLVAHWRLVEGVRADMDAVRRGLNAVLGSCPQLQWFEPDELETLVCGSVDDVHWSASALKAALKPDHGYTHDSPQVLWMVQMMCELSAEQRRKFLQFVTGSPRLPVGGFRALTPALTVVRKGGPQADADLPSAMTCYNYLKVPAYSSAEILRRRFDTALMHVYAFYLS